MLRTSLVALILLGGAHAEEPKPADREQMEGTASRLSEEGGRLFNGGRYVEAIRKFEESLAIYRQLYPEATHPDGHPKLALMHSNIGSMLAATGNYEPALPHMRKALTMMRAAYPKDKFPDGHEHLVAALGNTGRLFRWTGSYDEAIAHYREALTMSRALFPAAKHPDGHRFLGTTLNNLGFVLYVVGAWGESRPLLEEALAMRRRLHPEGHYDVANTLNNLGALHLEAGELDAGLARHEEALAINRRAFPPAKFPDGHPQLALSINEVAAAQRIAGRHAQALAGYEEALVMYRRLFPKDRYPRGQPDLQTALSNVGSILDLLNEHRKAVPLLEEAVAMGRGLYPPERFPNGHPDLARVISNLSGLRFYGGDIERAMELGREALAMRRAVFPIARFPTGHPELANGIVMLAFQHRRAGEHAAAVALMREAVAMHRGLYPAARYPDGHAELAKSLYDLGNTLFGQGEHRDALAHYEESSAMFRRLADRHMATASEADALEFLRALPHARDRWLSLSRDDRGADARAYAGAWRDKASLTRILQRRHAAARIRLAESPDAKRQYAELDDVHRQISQLIMRPGRDRAVQDRQLAALGERRDQLERSLAAVVPDLRRGREVDKLGPNDLQQALPKNSVLIDIVQYLRAKTHTEFIDEYAAFVVAPGQPVRRVELGPVAPLNRVVAAWRRAILRGDDAQELADLRRQLWEPLRAAIPAASRTLYVAPDGDLARVAWAALPGAQANSVLLDEFEGGIAIVPHGPFLLEQLKFAAHENDGPEPVLVVGGVDYGPGADYPALPGTAIEVKQVRALAGERPVAAPSGAEVGAERLMAELPKARYAHLATHGFFASAELDAEQRRAREQVRAWEFRPDATPTPRAGLGARSPLAYTGLAVAAANAGPAGIVSAEAIVGLPLEGLRLAVLSACETGLGEATGGEGVMGLQRAFHLAGCRNVIGSLWNVNDAATAALMAKFYHELWVEKKEPLAALREAQLTIYRHPELIPDLAGERGAPKAKQAVAAKLDAAPPQGKRAPTKLWAAFVLSGAGR